MPPFKGKKGMRMPRNPLYAKSYRGLKKEIANVRARTKQEWKSQDTVRTAAGQSSTPTYLYVTNLAVGTTDHTRIGNEIYLKSLKIKGSVINSATTDNEQLRILVIQDTQNRGVNPILSGTGGVLDTATILSFYKEDNRNRYRVKYDKVINMNNTFYGINAGTGHRRFFNKTIRFGKNGLKLYYSNDTAAVTGAGKNSIFVITFTEATSDYPSLEFAVRTQYVE